MHVVIWEQIQRSTCSILDTLDPASSLHKNIPQEKENKSRDDLKGEEKTLLLWDFVLGQRRNHLLQEFDWGE